MNNWNGIGSLLIACVELILLINLFVFAEKNKFNKTAMLIIFVLMIYQSLEFFMCQLGLDFPFMPYLAFVDIIILPPLIIVLLSRLYNYENKFLNLIFLPASVFIIYYTIVIDKFVVTSCTVLYATYSYPLGDLYGVFYYSPIIIATIILIKKISQKTDKKILKISKILLTGNVIISIPVIVGFVMMFTGNHYLIAKIESVMCKFAFFYAVCLSIAVLYNSKGKDERDNPEHILDN
jgi:hypothetical protein